MKTPLWLFLTLFTIFKVTAQTKYFVKTSSEGLGDGSSWSNASNDLSNILLNALYSDTIWVAKGVYKPTNCPPGCNSCTDPRVHTFTQKAGVSLFGGFSGLETALNERDLIANETVLSGDIGIVNDSLDNAYHVIILIGDSLKILDGFTIEKGQADNGYSNCYYNGRFIEHHVGSGVYLHGISNTLRNLKIQYNYSSTSATIFIDHFNVSGGAINLIEDCLIRNNRSQSGTAGIYSSNTYLTRVNRCFFINNRALDGGAILVNSGFCEITNSAFVNNVAINSGGAVIALRACSISNSTFYNNSAYTGAGVLLRSNTNGTSYSIINNVFHKNKRTSDPSYTTLYNDFGVENPITSADYIRLEYNLFQEDSSKYSIFTIPSTFSNNLFQINPYFTDEKNIIGNDNIFGTLDDGLIPLPCSPLVNSGNTYNTGDLRDIGKTQIPQFSHYDIGAYEYSGNLAPSLAINNLTITDSTFTAGQHISISNSQISNSNTANFIAGSSIIFHPTFEAPQGSVFSAKIGGECLEE